MLTDAQLDPAFETIRDKDETLLWFDRPHFVPFLLSGIPFLIIGSLWGAMDYFIFIRNILHGTMTVNHQHQPNPQAFLIPFFFIHMAPFWLSILNMFRLLLIYKNTCYAFSNKRVMMRTGFFGISFKTVDYDKIVDLRVDVGPILNLCGVGTIRIDSGATNSKGVRMYDSFLAIANPYEVFKKLKEATVDIKTDWDYPNALRPAVNPGFHTEYKPGGSARGA